MNDTKFGQLREDFASLLINRDLNGLAAIDHDVLAESATDAERDWALETADALMDIVAAQETDKNLDGMGAWYANKEDHR